MYDSKTALKLRGKVSRFSGVVSKGLCKVSQRFVGEMLYGLQAQRTIMLSEIGRALCDKVSLKKTEERLSRQLNRFGLGRQIQNRLIEQSADRIKEDTLLIVDISDVRKKYARKMEYLGGVHDGSENDIGQGYWTCQVVAANLNSKSSLPIYGHIYSVNAPDSISENREVLHPIQLINKQVSGRGIWVIDRGGDRRKIILPLLEGGINFIIRQNGNRHVVYRGEKVLVEDLAETCPMFFKEFIVREKKNKEKIYELELGYRPVKFPEWDKRLNLVVIRGFGKKPMMLLTSLSLTRSRKSLLRILESYIRRWDIEEQIRFMKQTYDIENVRVLRYQSLQNLYPLVIAAAYFVCAVLDQTAKLKLLTHKLLFAAKRIFGIPDFRYYAIANGLATIFQQHPGNITPMNKSPDLQMLLPITNS